MAQSTVMLLYSPDTVATTPPVAATYSDNFDSYTTDGAILYGQGSWLQEDNVQRVAYSASDGEVWSNASGSQCATYYNGALANDQYSQAVVTTISFGASVGVVVRCSGGSSTYYAYYSSSNAAYMGKVVSGTWTSFGTVGTPFEADDIIKLEVEGTTIRAYKNGSLDTSVGTNGVATDAAISSGYAGVGGYGSSTISRIDNWEAGEL